MIMSLVRITEKILKSGKQSLDPSKRAASWKTSSFLKHFFIYFMAWQKKLKGVTIYRDGSRFPILSVDSQLTNFQEYKTKQNF